MSTPRRAPSLIQSFNYAFEGIIHVLRTQRNMRIHFAVALIVLIAGLAVDVSRLELIALLLAIAFVLIAEMINTALEAAIDVATTSFDPMAKPAAPGRSRLRTAASSARSSRWRCSRCSREGGTTRRAGARRGGAGLCPLLELPRWCGRAGARRASVRGRQRRERRVPARD